MEKKRYLQIFIVSIISAALIRIFILDAFIVEGNSMAPNVLDGDYVFINKISYNFTAPERGDIVMIESNRLSNGIIKRIIGMPRERIEIKDGVVTIKKDRLDSGDVLEELYIKTDTPIDTKFQLDPYEYFVLGDNRYFSIDSRELGGFSINSIKGKLLFNFSPR